MYRIYVLSSKESQIPYEVENKIEFNKILTFRVWKLIGEIDDLSVAREMIKKKDSVYMKHKEKEYWLEHEPSNDMRYDFCKIEYGDNVEYYDIYHNTMNIFERRFVV